MSEKEIFEKAARENLGLSGRRVANFVREAQALRENLKRRKEQMKQRKEKQCMPLK